MRLRLITLAVVLAIGVLAVMAWQRNTAPAAPSAGTSEAPDGSMPGEAPMGGESAPQDPGIEWAKPQRWVAELAQGMRLASYSIPASGKGDGVALCAVYYFGQGQGGGVDANIDRWIGEFENPGKPVRRSREIHGMHVTQVEATGAYSAHAMSQGEATGVQSGWTLLGAIVEGPKGAVFFKLTGPQATVAAAAKEFDGMLASLKTR